MFFEDIQFPVYRKYKNNTTFFKVLSRDSFEEIQFIGNRTKHISIKATQLPEMNHIYDLVYNYADFGTEITENEWLETLKKVQNL
jgi:hypothetical protein